MKIDFGRIVGHEYPKVLFKHIIETDEWAPAYIFEGPKGVGKASFALEVIKATNCLSENIRPCQECSICRRIQGFQFPDLWVLLPDKPEGLREELGKEGGIRPKNFDTSREISINQVREIKIELSRSPYEGKRRFILVLNAENLSIPAQNAMLKILEEPPYHSTFLLISSIPEKVLSTIRSRSRRIHFAPLSYDTFSKYPFKTEIPLPLLFHLSSGCIGEAQVMLSSETWRRRRELLKILKSGSLGDFVDLTSPFLENRNELKTLVEIWSTLGRDLLLSKIGVDDVIMHLDLREEILETAQEISIYSIETFINLTLISEEGIRKYLPSNLVILPLFYPFLKQGIQKIRDEH